MRNLPYLSTLVISLGLTLSSCALKIMTGQVGPPIIYPFADFKQTPSAANLLTSTMDSYGNAIPAASWDATTPNGSLAGAITFQNGVFSYDRAQLTSCTSGVAPNCAITIPGTSGSYGGTDMTVYPGHPSFVQPWGKLKQIAVRVHHVLLTNTFYADCGIAFGLGEDKPQVNAPQTPKNLKLLGRSGGSDPTHSQDQFRFLYRISPPSYNPVPDAFAIDARVNVYGGMGPGWSVSQWSNQHVQNGSFLAAGSDFIDYDLSFDFDHVGQTIKITVIPVSSNKNMSTWQSTTLTWPFTSPVGTMVGGEARGGLDFSHLPVSPVDFDKQTVAIGLTANSLVKTCQFSNMAITLNP